METYKETYLDILKAATVRRNSVVLNCGQIERSVYEDVDTCLRRLGGKWKGGKTKAHVFPDDPSSKLQAVIDAGEMPVDNPLAYFPTPQDLCNALIEAAELPLNGARILEPSAGQGAICEAVDGAYRRLNDTLAEIEMEPATYSLDVCEFDPINRSILKSQGRNVVGTDFLEYKPTGAYDVIVMNPPFVVAGDARADQTHLRHAYSMLSDRGVIVSVTNGGWETKEQKPYQAFRGWLDDKLTSYEYISGGTFETTKISTRLIRIDKQNWRLNEYSGWDTHFAWNWYLLTTNDPETYAAYYNPALDFSAVEKLVRDFYIKTENIYIPLPEVARKELEARRIEDLAEAEAERTKGLN